MRHKHERRVEPTFERPSIVEVYRSADVVETPIREPTITEAIDNFASLARLQVVASDLVVLGRLQNVSAAIGDFRRVLAELPANTPAPIRAAVGRIISIL